MAHYSTYMAVSCAVTVLSVRKPCLFLLKGAVLSGPIWLGSDNGRFICVIVHNGSQMSRIMQIMCQDGWRLKSGCLTQILLSQMVLTKILSFLHAKRKKEKKPFTVRACRVLMYFGFAIVMWPRDVIYCKCTLLLLSWMCKHCSISTFVLF